MRALVADGRGSVVLRDVPFPQRAEGTAVVRLEATSLNRGELRVLDAAPDAVPGWDVVGRLEEDVPDLGLWAGDRVVGLVASGAWAERVAVRVGDLALVPDAVPVESAAALPVAGVTALRAVRAGGSILGRRVLVTGASGGVGGIAVQLAAASGAEVVAVARRGSDRLRALGAARVVTSADSLDGRFDLVVETVGGAALAAGLAHLAPGGTLMSLAASDPTPVVFEPRTMFNGSPGARIVPWNVFDGTAAGGAGDDLRTLLSLVGCDGLDPQVAAVVPWTDADAMVGELRERRIEGKAVLRVG